MGSPRLHLCSYQCTYFFLAVAVAWAYNAAVFAHCKQDDRSAQEVPSDPVRLMVDEAD
jgi:hypothetical protein